MECRSHSLTAREYDQLRQRILSARGLGEGLGKTEAERKEAEAGDCLKRVCLGLGEILLLVVLGLLEQIMGRSFSFDSSNIESIDHESCLQVNQNDREKKTDVVTETPIDSGCAFLPKMSSPKQDQEKSFAEVLQKLVLLRSWHTMEVPTEDMIFFLAALAFSGRHVGACLALFF